MDDEKDVKKDILSYLKHFGIVKGFVKFQDYSEKSKYTQKLEDILNRLTSPKYTYKMIEKMIDKIPPSKFTTIPLRYDNRPFLHKFIGKLNVLTRMKSSTKRDYDLMNKVFIKLLKNKKIDWTVPDFEGKIPILDLYNCDTIYDNIKYIDLHTSDASNKFTLLDILMIRNGNHKELVKYIQEKYPKQTRKSAKVYDIMVKKYDIKFTQLYDSNRKLFAIMNKDNRVIKAINNHLYNSYIKSCVNNGALLNHYEQKVLEREYDNKDATVKFISKIKPPKKSEYNVYPVSKEWQLKVLLFFFNLDKLHINILYHYTVNSLINRYHDNFRIAITDPNNNDKPIIMKKKDIINEIREIINTVPAIEEELIIYRGISHIDDIFTSITSFSIDSRTGVSFSGSNLISINMPKKSKLLPLYLLSGYPDELEFIVLPLKLKKVKTTKILPIEWLMEVTLTNKVKKSLVKTGNIYTDEDEEIMYIDIKKNMYELELASKPIEYIKYVLPKKYIGVEDSSKATLVSKKSIKRSIKMKKNIETSRIIKDKISNKEMEIVISK